MKKGLNLIIYIMIIAIIILLIWIFYPKFKANDNNVVFKFNTEKMEIKIGSDALINYEVSEGLNIIWESNNKDVVTVHDGILTGVSLGNTFIKGTVQNGDETITNVCLVSTYYGDKGYPVSNIVVPEGELFITKGDTYKIPINYEPYFAYINSIDYGVIDSNIASFSDEVVVAKNIGTTNISITVNKSIYKIITVNVIEKNISPTFSHRVENVNVSDDNISLKINESKKIDYNINPNNAFIESVKWESSNPSVAVVYDGNISAVSDGEAIIKLTINDEITKEIKVTVSVSVIGIKLESKSNLSLKVGQTDKINVSILPSNASNKEITFTSNNPSSVSVNNDGVVTAIGAGSGSITAKSIDGGFSISVNYKVNPSRGVIDGNGDIWGYTSAQDKTPERADIAFFQRMASQGKGVLSGNIYTYTDAKRSYKYNISNSTLTTDNRDILMRIYYPPNVDLSNVNTFTFFGGVGELGFSGYMTILDNNRENLSSSGIIILVSGKSNYNENDGILSTDFVRSIVNQKSGCRNAIGGYSLSGPAAANAANNGIYDRLIIFDTYFNDVANKNNLKNKEIIVYSPVGDSMVESTISTLNNMAKNNYTNVTLVTNNQNLINSFSSSFLVVNPGNPMGRGHESKNITNAKVFSYACS